MVIMWALLLMTSFITVVNACAATLTGTARDTTGHTISGAIVIVRAAPSRREIARSQTDAEGAYTFSSRPVGEFSIEISSPGFSTVTVQEVRVGEQGTSMQPVMLEVGNRCGSIPAPHYLRMIDSDRAGRISGTIVDRLNNKPIPGADVKLVCETNRPCRETTSDAHGWYAFSLDAGAYSLQIRRSAYFDDEYRTYYVQAGFETVYYPLFLDRC
jgi:hypothetical protein